jgi:predicted TIM-barrel fold metal-dependent hydrolase
MSHDGHLTASEVRARLSHPIIDADGHWQEFSPVVVDELRRIGGEQAAEGFMFFRQRVQQELAMSVAERCERRIAQPSWWAAPTKNTRDRATAMMPRLLYERLDELGLDFAVIYPTAGLALPRLPDAAVRQATCRAFNVFTANTFAPFADRMTPAAVIPMHTPEEAIAELEYATTQLGLKVAMMGSLIRRPVPVLEATNPDLAPMAPWFDTLGLDSPYDYDQVWSQCVELRVAPTFHTGGRGFGLRLSPSNFVYNHIGHFAAAGEAVCKALFIGGVSRRFPTLNMAFLEGGVGWACQLFADLKEHWEKRSLQGLEDVDPKNLDRALLLELAQRYGSDAMLEALQAGKGLFEADVSMHTGGIGHLDDFSACQITQKEDLRDLFATPFYFGCEADDRMNAWAFQRRNNPLGARLNALFGSDIGHFDVPDMAAVVPEAYEFIEDELMSTDDFRDFMFANAVRLWGRSNPDFFTGTVVEKEAAAVLVQAGEVCKGV